MASLCGLLALVVAVSMCCGAEAKRHTSTHEVDMKVKKNRDFLYKLVDSALKERSTKQKDNDVVPYFFGWLFRIFQAVVRIIEHVASIVYEVKFIAEQLECAQQACTYSNAQLDDLSKNCTAVITYNQKTKNHTVNLLQCDGDNDMQAKKKN